MTVGDLVTSFGNFVDKKKLSECLLTTLSEFAMSLHA